MATAAIPWPDDPLSCCRFCLRDSTGTTDMFSITADQLPYSDLPQLFEAATAVKLDTSAGYSEIFCANCESQIRLGAKIRGDLLRIAHQWREMLWTKSDADLVELLTADSQSAEVRVEVDAGQDVDAGQVDVLKTEQSDESPACICDDIDKVENIGESRKELVVESNVADAVEGDDELKVASGSGDVADAAEGDDELNVELGSGVDDSNANGNDEDDNGDSSDPTSSSSAEEEDSDDKPIVRKTSKSQQRLATPLTCDICGSKLTSRYSLLRHMRISHQSNPTNTCHICGKTNLKRLNQHLRDHRKTDRYQCQHCPKSFCRLAMKEQHERQHTGERPFICEVCAFTFTSPAALKRHARRHTDPHTPTMSTNGQIIENPLPPMQAHRPRLLAADIVQKLPPRAGIRLECPLCHNMYVNRSSLQPHMKIQHGNAGLAAWKRLLETTCLVCAERFDDADRLAEHKLVHQRHQCPICKRRFQCSVTMEMHVKKHSKKERHHRCDICEALYPCAFTLRTHHRRAHTGDRPFKCSQCPLGFVERWELNAHMKKQHTFLKTLRPYQCKECPETFRTVDSLRVHTEKHTGRFRYQCQVCRRNQHSGPLLVQHMQSYHMEEWRAEEAAREAAAAAAAAAAVAAPTITVAAEATPKTAAAPAAVATAAAVSVKEAEAMATTASLKELTEF